MQYLNPNESRIVHRTPLIAWIAALGVILTIAAPTSAVAQTVTPPAVPPDLEVLPPNTAFLLGRGVGTQNYVCVPGASIGRVAWTLFTPEATLFSDEGEQLTTHFFGPNPDEPSASPFETGIVRASWQDSRDTSAVWARVEQPSFDPAFVTPGAIPWLLLKVVGTEAGPTGGGALTRTTFIQRVNTAGGAAPSTGCSLPTDIGRKAFVPYTADYVFYRN